MECSIKNLSLAPVRNPYSYSGVILNRQQAKERLSRLEPSSEEYRKLRSALEKTAGLFEISLPGDTYKVDASEYGILGGFGSSEHLAIGDAVKLKGLPENDTLVVNGSVSIKFRHIIPLAADFYAVAGGAISLPGGDDLQKTARFQKALNTLLNADTNQIRQVIQEIDKECHAVKNSSLPHHCYTSQMIEKNNAIKKIKGDIDALLIDNSDHFSTNAQDAYRIGHTLAIEEARAAGRQNSLRGLKYAYAIDAFACHFLTDLFAAGHIRNQRGPLEVVLIHLGFSVDKAKPLAGLLTGAQHEKDGNEGLNVTNGIGDEWRAYGDGCFWTPRNEENKAKAIAATQQSVDEIYEAYANPDAPASFYVYQLIPYATEFNPLPLYSVNQDCTTLTLYQGTEEVVIENKAQYLTKGISQALRYLPQSYVTGFIDSFIQTPDLDIPILDKVIVPQIERLTGVVWSMVGLASRYQVRQESQQINQKLDEMADGLAATYDNSVKILNKLMSIEAQLNQQAPQNLFQELLKPIATIKSVLHECQHYITTLDDDHKKNSRKKLWRAYNKMSSVLMDGTIADGRRVLDLYRSWLGEGTPPADVKILTTLWLRRMLDYQIKAFNLYITLGVLNNRKEKIQKQIVIFQETLIKQIQKNSEYIDLDLIYQSESYIELCFGKSEVKKLALSFFSEKL